MNRAGSFIAAMAGKYLKKVCMELGTKFFLKKKKAI
jgi:hypothetical protein